MAGQTKTGADLEQAIALAERAFPTGHLVDDYRLVRAEQMLAGGPKCTGPRCWSLTFKLTALIPSAPDQRVGAGGELFIVADLADGKAHLVGLGE